MVFAYLSKCPVLAYYHSLLPYLSLLATISAVATMLGYFTQHSNAFIRLLNWEGSLIIEYIIFCPAIYIMYIICWWKLFRTPSIIPAIERIARLPPTSPFKEEILHLVTLFSIGVSICIALSVLRFYYG